MHATHMGSRGVNCSRPAAVLPSCCLPGDLLKRGPGLYKVSGVNLSGSQQPGPSQCSGPAYSSC
jgi:hypothetical protein